MSMFIPDDMEPISIKTVNGAVIDLSKAEYIKRYVTPFRERLLFYKVVYNVNNVQSEVKVSADDTPKIEAMHGRIPIHETCKWPFGISYDPTEKGNDES